MKKLFLFLSIVCASIGAAHAETMYVVQGDLKYSVSLDSHCASLVEWLRDTAKVPVEVAIPDSVYYNEQSYPVTEIGARSFIMRGDLGAISLPNTLTRIGGAAFYGCRNLANVIIPDNVKSIRTAAFAGCSSLRNVVLGASLDSIEYAAFGGAALGAPTIDSITCLGAIPPVFTGQGIGIETDSLLLIDFFDSTVVENAILRVQPQNFAAYHQARGWREFRYLESILDGDAVYVLDNDMQFWIDKRLHTAHLVKWLRDTAQVPVDVVIPDSVYYDGQAYPVTTIGRHSFSFRFDLASVQFPNTLQTIAACAFYECENLTSAIIPNSVTHIYTKAFNYCSLNSLVLGTSVDSIGNSAFVMTNEFNDEYSYIDTITCLAPIPPTLYKQPGDDSLMVFDSLTIMDHILRVPAQSLSLYRNAPIWREFRHIEPIGGLLKIEVNAEDNAAEFVWPTDSMAATYIIDVRQDGEIVCHLTLNSMGQLIGVSFAPGRNASHTMDIPAVMSFRLENLLPATLYFYTIAAVDANDTPLHVYQGQFATNGYPDEFEKGGYEITPTPPVIPYDPYVHTDVVTPSCIRSIPQLVISDGLIYLRTDNTCYTLTGQRVR